MKSKIILLTLMSMILIASAFAYAGELVYYPMDEGSGAIVHDAWSWDGRLYNATIHNGDDSDWNCTDTALFGNGTAQPCSIQSLVNTSATFVQLDNTSGAIVNDNLFGVPISDTTPVHSYAVSLWFKTNGTDGNLDQQFIWFTDSMCQSNLRITESASQMGDGKVNMIAVLGTSTITFNDRFNLSTDTWYHFVMTIREETASTSNISVYINGVLNKTAQGGANSITSNYQGSNYGAYVFNYFFPTQDVKYIFLGKLGQFKLFNTSISPQDAYSLYYNNTLSPDYPWYTDVGKNQSTYAVNDTALLYSRWESWRGLNKYIFSWNASGTWQNESGELIYWHNVDWVNITKPITKSMSGKTIGWQVFVNGSDYSTTGIQTFEVTGDPCVPNWTCTDYLCLSGIDYCTDVNDTEGCGYNYTGNYSEFTGSCNLPSGYQPTYRAGDLSAITGDVVGEALYQTKVNVPLMILSLMIFLMILLIIALREKMR